MLLCVFIVYRSVFFVPSEIYILLETITIKLNINIFLQILIISHLAVDQAAVIACAHHQVEVRTVLEGEDDPDKVVVRHLVLPDKECALKVHAGHLGGPDGDAGGAVHLLADLLALVLELPLGLRLAPRVLAHGDRLHSAEIRALDARVLRTRVELVRRRVAVKVSKADVAHAVLVSVLLTRVGQKRTIVRQVENVVAVSIVVAVVAHAVAVNVQLVSVVVERTVVHQVGDAVQVAVIPVITGITYNKMGF